MNSNLFVQFMLSISITLFCGSFGFWVAKNLNKKGVYFKAVQSFILTKNLKFYTIIGLNPFTWMVKNTFFRHFNDNIKMSNRLNIDKAKYLMDEITISEICHLIGLIIVLIAKIIVFVIYGFNNLIVLLILLNISLNLYPALLQEKNKLRISKFIALNIKKYDS